MHGPQTIIGCHSDCPVAGGDLVDAHVAPGWGGLGGLILMYSQSTMGSTQPAERPVTYHRHGSTPSWACHWKRKIYTTTTVLWPLYRSTCISRHLRLRTGGFIGGESFAACVPLLMAFRLRRTCWSSPQRCYLYCLRTAKKKNKV